MPLVLDIEAAGLPEDEIPPAFRDSLKRKADKDGVDWLTLRGMHGLSSQIVCLGMLNSDTLRGRLLTHPSGETRSWPVERPPVQRTCLWCGEDVRDEFTAGPEHCERKHLAAGDYVFQAVGMGEMDAILAFWEVVEKHGQVVTFNGTGYDIPMLLQRGVLHGIRPSRHLLMPSWKSGAHLDIFEILSCRDWRFKASLAAWCEAFGIENPKGDFDGAGVTAVFEQGRISEIAECNARDLVATDRLARKVVPLLEGRVL